jgi:hypothetical protein
MDTMQACSGGEAWWGESAAILLIVSTQFYRSIDSVSFIIV